MKYCVDCKCYLFSEEEAINHNNNRSKKHVLRDDILNVLGNIVDDLQQIYNAELLTQLITEEDHEMRLIYNLLSITENLKIRYNLLSDKFVKNYEKENNIKSEGNI